MMPSDMQDDSQASPDPLRPAKRRKFYRKRTDTEEDEALDPQHPAIATPELQTVDELISQNGNIAEAEGQPKEDIFLSVADILRQRKAIHRRRGGIEFTNLNPSASPSATGSQSNALIESDETPADIKSVIERFAPQTGQVSETTDKHMYDFSS